MKKPIALLLTAFTGLSFAALAQEAPPILPEPGSPVARDTQTAPRKIGIDPLPVEERPSTDDTRGDMPAGAVSFEDILPGAVWTACPNFPSAKSLRVGVNEKQTAITYFDLVKQDRGQRILRPDLVTKNPVEYLNKKTGEWELRSRRRGK